MSVSPYDNTYTEIQLSELIRVFPPSNARRWLERLKQYSEFITRCHVQTLEENDVLRILNADLLNQIADLNARKNSSKDRGLPCGF